MMMDFENQEEAPVAVEASKICEGSGLFARKHINKDQILGCYHGEACVDDMENGEVGQEDEQKEKETVSLFSIAAGMFDSLHYVLRLIIVDMSIRPPKEKPSVYFINHIREAEANAKFMYIETPRTRIVIAVAKRDIEAEEEIVASYGEK
jgi:SET domain-containing protein